MSFILGNENKWTKITSDWNNRMLASIKSGWGIFEGKYDVKALDAIVESTALYLLCWLIYIWLK